MLLGFEKKTFVKLYLILLFISIGSTSQYGVSNDITTSTILHVGINKTFPKGGGGGLRPIVGNFYA